jgi:putative transposase
MPTVQRCLTVLLADDTDLRKTLEASCAVRQALSPVCFNDGNNLDSIELQRIAYHSVKGTLSAQMTISAIRSVAAAYKSARSNKRPAEAPFDFSRPLALFLIGSRGRDAEVKSDCLLSIWTVEGRKKIAFKLPEYFRQRFNDAVSFDSLTVIERNGRLIGRLAVSLEVREENGILDNAVGLDMGEINALTAVDGEDREFFRSGRDVKILNKRTRKTRKRLQKKLAARKAQGKDTRSVGRSLKQLGRKARNRTLDFARVTACKLMAWIPEGAILVWERLKGIPQPRKGKIGGRGKKGKALRRRLSAWQRRLVREACSRKAEMLGIPEAEECPRYTSQDCSRCHRRGKRAKHRFSCPHCGHEEHSDLNAPRNTRWKYICRVRGYCDLVPVGRCTSTVPEALPPNQRRESKKTSCRL